MVTGWKWIEWTVNSVLKFLRVEIDIPSKLSYDHASIRSVKVVPVWLSWEPLVNIWVIFAFEASSWQYLELFLLLVPGSYWVPARTFLGVSGRSRPFMTFLRPETLEILNGLKLYKITFTFTLQKPTNHCNKCKFLIFFQLRNKNTIIY